MNEKEAEVGPFKKVISWSFGRGPQTKRQNVSQIKKVDILGAIKCQSNDAVARLFIKTSSLSFCLVGNS